MLDERAKELLTTLDTTTVTTCSGPKFIEIVNGQVGHGIRLEVGPDILDRIQFWGVGWQERHVNACSVMEHGLQVGGAMRVESVPYQDHGLRDLSQQVAEEVADLAPCDVLSRMQSEPEIDSRALGPNRQAGNNGNLLIVTSTLMNNGRTPPRRPTATQQWSHQQSALVDENQKGIQLTGFFLARATGLSPTAQSAVRHAQPRDEQASGNSNPSNEEDARHDKNDTPRRIAA
jgi:hypothetical protein